MISCTEFIPAYSDLFRFLEKRDGKEAVIRFWHHLSDHFLGNLKAAVEKEGIQGCWTYWSRTLSEEAADFKMELDTKKGIFKGTLRHCPSKGRLLKLKHFKAYPDYCGHCDVLYRRVLEPLGYDVYLDMSECDRATCRFYVLKKGSPRPSKPDPEIRTRRIKKSRAEQPADFGSAKDPPGY
jgi:hypothetical protein